METESSRLAREPKTPLNKEYMADILYMTNHILYYILYIIYIVLVGSRPVAKNISENRVPKLIAKKGTKAMQTASAKATGNKTHEHDNDEYANGWQCRPSPLQTDLTSRFAELISLTSSDSEYMQGSKAQAQWQNPDPDEPGQGEITEDTSALGTKHGRQSDGDFSKAAAGQGSMICNCSQRPELRDVQTDCSLGFRLVHSDSAVRRL